MKAPIFSAISNSKAGTAAIISEMLPECPKCYGDGQVQVNWNTDSGHVASGWLTCPNCNGTKKATK